MRSHVYANRYALSVIILIIASILPNIGLLAYKEEAKLASADSCSQCIYSRQYTLMRPDSEILHEWLERRDHAPSASAHVYIDSNLEPPAGAISLLSHLEYDPLERDQGVCGNCWVWAGTGVLEIALDVNEEILDRLSIQYFNSKYNEGTGSNWAGCGGWLEDLADFYASEGFAIPWSNTNAAWADGTQTCADGTTIPWETIDTSPNYTIIECTAESIPSHGVGQTTAINTIKNVLSQGEAIWFGFFLPTGSDWDQFFDFWNYQSEDAVWNPDYSCGHVWDDGGGGHAVLCVGYNDTDPNNSYWIMVNSWGTAGGGRPNGIFLLDMDMDYDCYFYDLGEYYSFYWQTLNVTFEINMVTHEYTYLAARGADNRIYYRIYNSSCESWGSWTILPGATCDSPGAAVYENELHIVVRGVTGSLWHGYVNLTDSNFSGWTRLSGATPSAPTLTASATKLYLVVRGMNDRIYYCSWDGSSWGDWIALPGATTNRPAAAVLSGNLHMVVNGLNGKMYHGWVNLTNSHFSGWTRLSGSTLSAPALAASATKLYLVVRGDNNKIYYNSRDGTSWQGWTRLLGATTDSPAAAVLDGNLHLVVLGTGSRMYYGWVILSTSSFSGWTRLSGSAPSTPELAA